MATRTRRLLATCVMLLATQAPVLADEVDGVGVPPPRGDVALAQEDRIAELERTVKVLADELERTRTDLALPEEPELVSRYGLGPAASKVYGVERGLSIGGYGEAYYSKIVADSGNALDRADALRAVLYVAYKFTDSIVFNSEIEFEHATTESTESAGDGSVSVEFAALDFLWKDWANFRTGLVLVPMGYLNEIHEPTAYFGTHRPEVERQIIPSTWRENGIGMFGNLGEDVEYNLYVINGMNAKGFSPDGLRDGRQDGNRALAENLAVVGRLDWYPLYEWNLGTSLYYGNSGQNQDFDVTPEGLPAFDVGLPDVGTLIWEVHTQYTWKNLFLRGLFTLAHLEDAGELSRALGPEDEGGIGMLGSGEGIGGMMLGAYAEIAYDVLPLFFEGTQRSLEPFFRYEWYDTQRRMPAGFAKDLNKKRQIFTVGVDYKPIPNVVIKFDYRNRSAAQGELPDEFNMGIGYAF
jgi:hypothetical protein